jgi:hypothetical protein
MFSYENSSPMPQMCVQQLLLSWGLYTYVSEFCTRKHWIIYYLSGLSSSFLCMILHYGSCGCISILWCTGLGQD